MGGFKDHRTDTRHRVGEEQEARHSKRVALRWRLRRRGEQRERRKRKSAVLPGSEENPFQLGIRESSEQTFDRDEENPAWRDSELLDVSIDVTSFETLIFSF